MSTWPDKGESLLNQFVDHLKLRSNGSSYRSVLRKFQRFVSRRSTQGTLTQTTLRAWLMEVLKQSSLGLVVHNSQVVNPLPLTGWLFVGRWPPIQSPNCAKSTSADLPQPSCAL